MREAVILKVLLEEKSVKLINPELILQKKPGEHARIVLSGILELDNGPVTIVPEMDIQIYKEGTKKVLFQGLVNSVARKVETSNSDPLEWVELRALSYTCLFDRMKRNRSFQIKTQTYEAAAEEVIKSYPDSGIIMQPELTGRQLGSLAVQYQETDWEFLNRLASRLNCLIIASHITKGPKLFFGPAFSSARHVITEAEADQVEELSTAAQKRVPAFDGFSWITDDPEMQAMDIGEILQYMRIDFYIKELEVHIKNHGIRHRYLFCAKEAFPAAEIRNPKITGLSLQGTVTDISGNRVKVKLDIDVWTGGDCWYTYATFYSMFYCMPERGDRVHLYFPEDVEGAAFVLNSVKGTSNTGGGSVSSSHSEPGGVQPPPPKAAQAADAGSAEETVDLTPYINAIATQPGGELSDFKVEFTDGTNLSKEALMGGAGQGGRVAGSSRGTAAPLSGQSSSFESLAGDDKVKMLSTSDGKMVVLNDRTGSVSIFLNSSTYVVLDGGGVRIRSPQNVTIWADGDINLNAKTSVSVQAGEQLNMQCGGSGVVLEPGKAIICGTDIKLNE